MRKHDCLIQGECQFTGGLWLTKVMWKGSHRAENMKRHRVGTKYSEETAWSSSYILTIIAYISFHVGSPLLRPRTDLMNAIGNVRVISKRKKKKGKANSMYSCNITWRFLNVPKENNMQKIFEILSPVMGLNHKPVISIQSWTEAFWLKQLWNCIKGFKVCIMSKAF